MHGTTGEEEFTTGERRRSRARIAAGGIALLLLFIIAGAWLQRREIAADLIDRELARRGVAARYEVTAIGPRTQRLENVVIGDPARPDAVARSVIVELSWGWRRPRVERVIVRDAIVRARLVDGRVRLGQLDKLLPAPSGAPFRLPSVDADLARVGVRLATAAGTIGITLSGRGNLADGFRGRIAAAAPRLASGGCVAERVRAGTSVVIADAAPHLIGPITAIRAECGGLTVREARLGLDVRLGAALDRWRGRAGIAAAALSAPGLDTRRLSGSASFAGNADATGGAIRLGAASVGAGALSARRAAAEGRYAWSREAGASFRGGVAATGIDASAPAGQGARALAGFAGTPLGPIAAQLGDALARAGRSIDLRADLVAVSAGGGAVRAQRLDLTGASGARARLTAGALTYYAGPGRLRLDGSASIGGGSLPATRVVVRQADARAGWSGMAEIAPLAAGGADLRLAPVRFAPDGSGIRVDTVALLSGPVSGGAVRNLLVPVSGRIGSNGFVLGERCTPVRFDALRIGAAALGPTRLPLCPDGPGLVWSNGGGVRAAALIEGPRLRGTIGATPAEVAAARMRVTMAGFEGRSIDLALGPHRLTAASLDGRFTAAGIVGRFAGTDAKLANVPLRVEEATGTWTLAGGRLRLAGSLRVSDTADPSRFFPLVSRDFALTLAGNRIDANGWLLDPETGTRVTRATIAHDLAAGRGRAELDVPGIAFGPDYQPEQLTRLTTGVVALVNGTVAGRGEVAWGPDGVTSSGRFGTADMDLAAPFGPVEGLATSIQFTDLLGLVSAPGQEARVALVRTGIDVYDGSVRYQLLPEFRVRVEAGRWPFAGGDLLLRETVLDFAEGSEKRLTFDVRGLDAARFIASMEFENIAATGTFDGVVPMIFDRAGGRIEGGRLTARAEGGTLSYIGALTDRELGAYGKLAFDALKALRYSKLEIGLDGSLDGEFVAGIELDGIAREAANPGGIAGYVIGQLAKIPFEFNINVRGPFRALLATARSLEDPSLLIQDVLPQEIRDAAGLTTTIQTRESEQVRE